MRPARSASPSFLCAKRAQSVGRHFFLVSKRCALERKRRLDPLDRKRKLFFTASSSAKIDSVAVLQPRSVFLSRSEEGNRSVYSLGHSLITPALRLALALWRGT